MGKINATSQGVRVTGLAELNRALKALGPEVQKELKAANFEVGTMVADDAKSIAFGLGGVAAKVAPSIRATKTQAGAGVSFGGAAYPFAAGAEFGSLRYGRKASANPGDSPRLEWQTTSPPPTENFEETPVVTDEAYAFKPEEVTNVP